MSSRQTGIEWVCRLGHRLRIGHWPDLDTPQTFNEKIQAFKLRNRQADLARFVDKVIVKEHVANVLGTEWLIPSLWEGTQLPAKRSWPAPYVLKANNSSGRNIFVRSDSDENWQAVRRKAHRWLSSPHPAIKGEWLYSQIAPRLLVEPLLGGDRLPPDYKFFCFEGRVALIQLDTNRDTRHTRKLFDRNWCELDATLHYPRDPDPAPKPCRLGDMIAAAEALAQGLDFVRVDLYLIDGLPKFGEITFTPGAGVERFSPPELDLEFGRLWPWS